MRHIQALLLNRVRLTTYFWMFLVGYFVLSYVVPNIKYDPGSIALFSVNSFLYGFIVSPILNAQKARIDDLHRIVRAEANALFSLMLKLKRLPPELRHQIQDMVKDYMRAKLRSRKAGGGEKEYEALISFCVDYKGPDQEQIDKVLEAVVANQQNRTNFNMQAANRVYANEWHVIAILFSITLTFILTLSTPDAPALHVVRALICTGLTMLVLIIIKLSTLTHKRAQQMWQPLDKLLATNFYRFD